ncbi:MAG: GGDEF domain-containing protein, partial [Gammaproteobacteria bacterium]
LIIWFALLFVGSMVRVLISCSMCKSIIKIKSDKKWAYTYGILTCIFALVWGASGVIFFIPDSIGHQLFLSILLCGIVAGSVSSLPVFLPVFYFFAFSLMLPVTIMLFLYGEGLVLYMALLCIVFILYISMAGFKSHAIIVDALASRFRHEDLARTDELTQVMNRRAFNDVLSKEIGRARRSRRLISFILCDIDNFKKINDTYGHIVGDAILKKTASVLESSIRRPSDTIARFGGEEFAIILAETDQEGVSFLAEKIRQNIEKESQNWETNITISLGVYNCVPGQDTVPEQIVHKADKALYLAKNEGRNQVQVFKD